MASPSLPSAHNADMKLKGVFGTKLRANFASSSSSSSFSHPVLCFWEIRLGDRAELARSAAGGMRTITKRFSPPREKFNFGAQQEDMNLFLLKRGKTECIECKKGRQQYLVGRHPGLKFTAQKDTFTVYLFSQVYYMAIFALPSPPRMPMRVGPYINEEREEDEEPLSLFFVRIYLWRDRVSHVSRQVKKKMRTRSYRHPLPFQSRGLEKINLWETMQRRRARARASGRGREKPRNSFPQGILSLSQLWHSFRVPLRLLSRPTHG